jgi:hypothetical protein
MTDDRNDDDDRNTADRERIRGVRDVLAACPQYGCPSHIWSAITTPTDATDTPTVAESGVIILREDIRRAVEKLGARASSADLDTFTIAAAAVLGECAAALEMTAAHIIAQRSRGELGSRPSADLDMLARLTHRSTEEGIPAALAIAGALNSTNATETERAGEATRAEIMIGRALIVATATNEPDAFRRVTGALARSVAALVEHSRTSDGGGDQ